MRFCTLASGSSGNSVYIEQGDTRLLIDAGISLRAIETALRRLGTCAKLLTGVLVTHEHSDHTKGLYQLAMRTGVPIYGGRDTVRAVLCAMPDMMPDRFTVFAAGPGPYRIGEFTVTAFPTSHDVPCLGYRVEGEATVAVATDLGRMDEVVYAGLAGADFVVLECNHDVEMLRCGSYPPYLKRRILSEEGHLSNECCAAAVCRLVETGCRHFVLGHLSESNNHPRLALEAVCGNLLDKGVRPGQVTVDVAPRYEMSRVFEL
ncbi:MAG TPA: MBL fold metallo-hydrolase [Terriglobales bacterium]|nr:MBL fold metallo-hydrolase [Terriglobales bacterium]